MTPVEDRPRLAHYQSFASVEFLDPDDPEWTQLGENCLDAGSANDSTVDGK